MKLCIFTIVLDGFPWITKHLTVFQQLKCDWQWIVVHGAAMNNGSTRWCKPQEPRFSEDGTSDYLNSIITEPEVEVVAKTRWESKDEMVNAALERITEPCVLMEIDSDEIWEPWQLDKIVTAFEVRNYNPPSGWGLGSMQFRCRYFVGPNLITQGERCYGDMDYEWWRAWKFEPGIRFFSHEPPNLNEYKGYPMFKDESQSLGLIFDHMAYATEAQVKFKQDWYGRNGEYDGLLDGWRRLQEVKEFPVKLSDFFPQVKGDLPLVVKVDGLG